MQIERQTVERQQKKSAPVAAPGERLKTTGPAEERDSFQTFTGSGDQNIRRRIGRPEDCNIAAAVFAEQGAANLPGIQKPIRLADVDRLHLSGQHRNGQTEQRRSAFSGGRDGEQREVRLPAGPGAFAFRPLGIPAEEDEALRAGGKIDRRIFDDRSRGLPFIVDPPRPRTTGDKAGLVLLHRLRDGFRRNRPVCLIAKDLKHAGFRVETPDSRRRRLPDLFKKVAEIGLIRLTRRRVGVVGETIEIAGRSCLQCPLHPGQKAAGTADAVNDGIRIDRLDRTENGAADLGIILRILRHTVGVRLVFNLVTMHPAPITHRTCP